MASKIIDSYLNRLSQFLLLKTIPCEKKLIGFKDKIFFLLLTQDVFCVETNVRKNISKFLRWPLSMFAHNFHRYYISPRAHYLFLQPTLRNSGMLKFIILRLHRKIVVKVRVDDLEIYNMVEK